MSIKELNLSNEDLQKVKELLENNGFEYENNDDLLNEDEFHMENSSEDMLAWKYDERNDMYKFSNEYCNITVEQIVESGCKTLGEFFLCDDCINVISEGKEVWLKFYV